MFDKVKAAISFNLEAGSNVQRYYCRFSFSQINQTTKDSGSEIKKGNTTIHMQQALYFTGSAVKSTQQTA